MEIRSAFAALAFTCALAAAAQPGTAQSQQKPVGLQYDEIVRFVVAPATPPPAGSFQGNYQQLMADAQNAPSNNAQPHGLFNILAAAGQQVVQAANAMQTMFKDGNLTRKAYYNNWVRTDDPVAKTATIVKCAQHETIQLDLAHKTYHVADTRAKPTACNTPMPIPMGPQGTQVENMAPGTANLRVSSTQTGLGPMTLDGVPTNGYSNSTTVAMTNATGSCKNGSFATDATRYVSNIRVPRAYCPLPTMRVALPSSPVETVVHGGCKPHMTGSMSGAYWSRESGLEMYSLLSMRSAQASAGRSFTIVSQRGNVQWLTKPQADALFSVPADFTQK